MHRRALAEQPCTPQCLCELRATTLARGSTAPCNGNCDKSHLLTLHHCSVLLQHRLLLLSAVNPGRSWTAEAVTRLQNTPLALAADPEQAPALGASKASTRLAADIPFAWRLFWVSPLASTGMSLAGLWQLLLVSRSADTFSLHPHPVPASSPAKMHLCLSTRTDIASCFRAQASLTELLTAPGTLGLAIKNNSIQVFR